MNIISKVLLIYNSAVALIIVGSLFIGKGNLYIYLLLVPLPIYFILFTWGSLFKKKTEIGLTFKKFRILVLIFLGLVAFGAYKIGQSVNIKPEPIHASSWQIVATPTPEVRLLMVNKNTKIYEKQATDSAVIGKALKSDVYLYTQEQDGWFEISLDATSSGFIKDTDVDLVNN